MKHLLVAVHAAPFIFASALAVHAQAPANDLFANAITLNGPIVTTTGSNVGATKQFGGGGGEPSIPGAFPGAFGGASVWWNWTASASGQTTIDTQGSDFNTLLGVFTGPAQNQLRLVAGNDDFEGNQWSRVTFDAAAGTTYHIMVDGYRSGPGFGSPAMGNIVLHVKGVGGLEISLTNGMVFTVGDPIPVSVSFTPDFPNPPAQRVDFYRRGSPFAPATLFASVSNAPFIAVATNIPAGSNTFYVAAFDSLGNPVESPAASVLVQNVGVTFLTPFEDTVYAGTNPVPVTAWAFLPSGVITNIEFFVDGTKFGEDDTAPFSGSWSNVVSGSHRLTAVGHSDTGARYNSQPVNIGVAQLLVHSNAVWKYLDDGSDQGTAWIAPDFEDDDWSRGAAELGYGDNDEATVVHSGPTNNYYITTYFRRSFVASNVASLANLIFLLAYDDAAVVYLNGNEIYRTANLPAAPTNITYTTFATGQAIEETVDVFARSATNLLEGENVLAVEIHQQALTSSDISFFLQLVGVPVIIHNQSPLVALTSPTNNFYALAPSSLTLEAIASDLDGSVTRVDFFADRVRIGGVTNEPYSIVWDNPPVAAHVLTAVATDDQGATTVSDEVPIVVYDGAGTPVAAITYPADGATMDGPTNLLVTATANAITGVTNVQFLNNGVPFGSDDTAPYTALWTAPFGTNVLTAVAYDANGITGTSPAITVVITIPPTNVIAPTVATQFPLAGASVTNLTSITVTFSEYAQNLDASDLLINGVPASSVSANNSRSNYTFTFPQPPYGAVNVTWAADHGITDYGWPTVLPFDATGPGATWGYTLLDRTPPIVVARVPAAGSTVTNLNQVGVTFSESVSGVDAADLLLNGTPALTVAGAGTSYTFDVAQPNSGTINVTWATNNDIFDLADVPNAFNRASASNTWSFVLDTRVVLVQSNSTWRFVKGLAEASIPTDAWRQPAFDDSSWSNAPAPFFFGDPYTNAAVRGTPLSDMQSNYTTIFLRKEFTVVNPGIITNLLINHQSDDGFIAWLNGVEVLRYNVPGGELPYNATASAAVNEPSQSGAAYIVAALTNSAAFRLVAGTNILAIQALNQNLTTSSDFGFNAQLYFFPVDPATVPPRLISAEPAPGDVFSLTNVTVNFSEGVSGVDAADLLVNGTPATDVSSTTNATYTFSFDQPAYGPVLITWATNHEIVDFDETPRSFDSTAVGSTLSYTLLNPSSPRIATQIPAASTTLTGLTAIAVTFTEPVTGVDASDLLVSGVPADTVSSTDDTTYNFTFTQPPFGTVTIRWATNNGITDLEQPPAAFDPVRFGAQWNYTLINPVPSVALTSPTNNAYVLAPANVPLGATASDNDGTVALVEFYESNSKLGEGTNAPYTLTISNVPVGIYTFRAVATDNIGLRGTSAPVVLNVVTSLPVSVVRGPYLQIGSPTGGVVRWRTDLFSDAVVYYGTDLSSLTNLAFDAAQTNEHIIPIGRLQPDTKYFYSIGTAAQTNAGGPDYWFKTSPVPGTRRPIRFWAIGDAGTAGNGPPDRQQSTRDAFYNYAATNGQADFWLMLGDNAYNSGLDSEYQAAVFDMYPTMLRNKFLWPTIGNHESAQSFTATQFPYLDIFSLPHNGEAGGVPSGTQKYYSFDYANIHFVCLDSMTSGRSATNAMGLWLQADLAAANAEWIVVFFHHPPYTKGNHDSDRESELIEIRQNLLPIFETNGVDIVLCGHSHAWERSYLLNGHYGLSSTLTPEMKIDGGDGREDGDGAYRKNELGQGVVYTVAGNAGQVTGGTLDHPAHFLSLNELGTMVIDINGNRLDAILLEPDGLTHDHFTILKPPPTPSAPLNLVAVPTSPSEVGLSWIPGSTNQLGYSIERSVDGVNFIEQSKALPDVTSVTDSGLLLGVTYFYRVRATNSFGPSDYSNIASLTTVAPTDAPRAPAALTAGADNGIEFYRSQMILRWQDRSTNEAGFQIERSLNGSAFVPVATVAANVSYFLDRNLASATAYDYRIRALNSLGSSAPSNIAGDETHPQSQLVRAGENAVFHAGIEGVAPILYQWRFMGTPIAGQTNESLVIANAQPSNEGEYTVVVRDASGRIASNPAFLFVTAPPSIVSEPPDRIGLTGMEATLTVTVAGTEPLTYQWRKNGTLIVGATGPTLTIPNVQFTDQAGYYVIVQNDFGSITSRVATISVYTLPSVAPVADMFTEIFKQVSVTNSYTDPNVPPLDLSYALAPGAPTNATLNATSGVFRWTPDRSQSPATNPITVLVRDATRPELTSSTTFTVQVNDYLEVTVGSLILYAGESNSIPIDVFSSAALLDLQGTLNFPSQDLGNVRIEELAPQLATVSLQMSDSNTAALIFTATPGHTLQGTQHLALLHFTTSSNQPSAFAPVTLSSLSCTKASADLASPTPTLLVNNGRVTVLGAQGLLEARITGGQRQLTLYGKVGVTYTIESRFGFAAGTSWANRNSFNMTNTVRTVGAPSGNAPLIFYRLRN
jgi:hypothetical protein